MVVVGGVVVRKDSQQSLTFSFSFFDTLSFVKTSYLSIWISHVTSGFWFNVRVVFRVIGRAFETR